MTAQRAPGHCHRPAPRAPQENRDANEKHTVKRDNGHTRAKNSLNAVPAHGYIRDEYGAENELGKLPRPVKGIRFVHDNHDYQPWNQRDVEADTLGNTRNQGNQGRKPVRKCDNIGEFFTSRPFTFREDTKKIVNLKLLLVVF